MWLALLNGGEDTGGLDNIVDTALAPWNLGWVTLCEDGNVLSVDDELSVLGLDGTVEASVGGVVLEHVDHVVEWHEWIVDGNNLNTLGDSSAQDNATDTAESVNSN